MSFLVNLRTYLLIIIENHKTTVLKQSKWLKNNTLVQVDLYAFRATFLDRVWSSIDINVESKGLLYEGVQFRQDPMTVHRKATTAHQVCDTRNPFLEVGRRLLSLHNGSMAEDHKQAEMFSEQRNATSLVSLPIKVSDLQEKAGGPHRFFPLPPLHGTSNMRITDSQHPTPAAHCFINP